MKKASEILVMVVLLASATNLLVAADRKKESTSPIDSEQMAKGYLDSFQQTGIPTPNAVKAAFAQAKEKPTIENWESAAKMANSLANIISDLKDSYGSYYRASQTSFRAGDKSYLDVAAGYEEKANRYLGLRNDAYVELAKIFLDKGEKVRALSYAMTVVKLSGPYPSYEAEKLIHKIIEYQK